ncbi:hypothetical protein J6590_042650 [Homalodisca vitripennis]|nr:hypothetical protein J6590_042650 [Homalodisca vitripennis]
MPLPRRDCWRYSELAATNPKPNIKLKRTAVRLTLASFMKFPSPGVFTYRTTNK